MAAETDQAGKSAYALAGVDIEAGERAVELMKASIAKTRRPEVLGGIGGFAGLFDAATLAKYAHPLLATSTDGVGTKVDIARQMGVYDTVGYDLVGMLIDDLVVVGAEPLFLTDYIACGKVFPERVAAIVRGIANACAENNVALLGGETAEHPGLLQPDEFDIAGATTGVVEADNLLGPERVQEGDVVIALASSGLHSNGFSLVRRVFLRDVGALERYMPELGQTLGEALLTPTKVYAADLLQVLSEVPGGIHAMSHVTGGGLANNLARVLPAGLSAMVDRATWTPPAIFQLAQQAGGISQPDIEATLNQGVGMVLLAAPEAAARVQAVLDVRQVPSWVCGIVESTPGASGAHLFGAHR
ncbi:MAG: phosphoribosylformylglycinamidine cyclo-ligase [Propionibacteriaceae bacterium]|jgi:phosphoribosylformylglycinamidine cyclo-ligase|nr:phosphoribosylformylglycinamidine cyclo-ligase [Propionibacteriaceae bacterium]